MSHRIPQPPTSATTVHFTRRRAIDVEFPLASVVAADRPVRAALDIGNAGRIALLAAGWCCTGCCWRCSGGRRVRWRASASKSMSVEITLGASRAAGLAPQPGKQEVEPVTAPEATAQDIETPEPQAPVAEMPDQKLRQEDERMRADAPNHAGKKGRLRSRPQRRRLHPPRRRPRPVNATSRFRRPGWDPPPALQAISSRCAEGEISRRRHGVLHHSSRVRPGDIRRTRADLRHQHF